MIQILFSRVLLSAAGALGAHVVYLAFKQQSPSTHRHYEDVYIREKAEHAISGENPRKKQWTKPWRS